MFKIKKVGPTYGRKMMTGYIANKHELRIGHNRIGSALARTAPQNHLARRTNTARLGNPIPYRAHFLILQRNG